MGTAIELYKPLPQALLFHKSDARFRIIRGSNRAGKTLASCIEFAMICMGIHPWIKQKNVPAKDGKAIIVGKDAHHLADPIWRTMYYPGAFWVIPDEITGELRPLKVNRKKSAVWMRDKRRRAEWRPAPPIITDNMLAAPVVWTNKGRGIPSMLKFKSGWETTFHTAEGNPRQGAKFNLAWFDEEIPSQNWYRETFRGLIDGDGIFWWSATPQDGSLPLYALHEKCEQDEVNHEEFFLHIKDNPYLGEQAKREFLSSLLTQEDIRVCWDGEYMRAGYLVYPELDAHTGGINNCSWPSGPPPYDWMKVVATDPGHRTTASIFAAVSPEGEIHIYDELYMKGASASDWGPRFKKKLTSPDGYIETPDMHIFDMQFGRQTLVTGETVADYYMAAAGEQGIRNRTGGRKFITGNKDVLARTEAVKDKLLPDPVGNVKVKIDPKRCPNLMRELAVQRWKQGGRDKRESVDDHLVDAFEYLLSYPLKYRQPQASLAASGKPGGNSVVNIYRNKLKRQKGHQGKKLSDFKKARQEANKGKFDLSGGSDHRVAYD